MKKYAGWFSYFFTFMGAMSLTKLIGEFIDDTPLEFNHRKVFILLAMSTISILIGLYFRKRSKEAANSPVE